MIRVLLVVAGAVVLGFAGLAEGLIEGMNVAAWWHGRYGTPEAHESLRELRDVGAEWVAIVVTCYQESVDSPVIRCLETTRSPSLPEVRGLIRTARSLGFKVLLKPHLDIDDDTWRGSIDFGEDEDAWREWFRAYAAFILRYARLAQEEAVDMFCVGVELGGTVRRTGDWREVIRAVREFYSGPLVYAANWDGEMWRVPFWCDLDYIGIDAYYPLTGQFSPTLEGLVAAWKGPLRSLGCLAMREGKPVIFTEIGYRSLDGALREPWNWTSTGTPDPEEQARGYRAFFEAVWGKPPWFAGVFFWYWEVDPAAGGPMDTGYTPQNKPAEGILREYFQG
ncbi:glycoside hydrolase family 113 [Candidatus Bipolaricaulota sp. J31]